MWKKNRFNSAGVSHNMAKSAFMSLNDAPILSGKASGESQLYFSPRGLEPATAKVKIDISKEYKDCKGEIRDIV